MTMGAPFDNAAASYDEEFQTLPGTGRLRRIILRHAFAAFPPSGSLLELNCGTGTDAIALAKEGFRVFATDESSAMVMEADRKVRASGLESRITCRTLGFNQLGDLEGQKFDGVFSNLGGLNCAEELGPVGARLYPLMNPGAIFLAVLLSPYCVWEMLSFAGRGNGRSALRRLSRGGTTATIHGSEVRVFFHTPQAVEKALRPYFRKKMRLGLNVITPPPASRRAYSTLRPLIPFLESVEDRLARVTPFNIMGDHYLTMFKRVP
ncbi:MAG: methyltransferase domain-containing protein [Ignavibacteria bacterium]|nr:methyltransferase domain-containing protein [Ignavibacteria bacterium]